MELHDLKLKLQGHLTDGLVTVVGSGLSCAEGLPSMTDLANYLKAKVPPSVGGADKDRWEEIFPLLVTKGLEAALLQVPPTPALESIIVTHTADLVATREREVVTEIFCGTRTLKFTRLVKHLIKPQSGLPIITTNYDRLIEISVEEAGLGVETLFVGHFAGEMNEAESRLSFCREVSLHGRSVRYHFRPRAIVFKPHGSLDWYRRGGKPVRYSGDLALPRLIITPGLNKFRGGYDSPFDRHRDRANLAIDRAARFLVIGYGFNDDHLETHLTPRIRDGVPTLLITRSLSSNAAKLVASCASVTSIERSEVAGVEGSSISVAGMVTNYPGLNLWDLGEFVDEVLEQ